MNRYTFTWKRGVWHHQRKMEEKFDGLMCQILEEKLGLGRALIGERLAERRRNGN